MLLRDDCLRPHSYVFTHNAPGLGITDLKHIVLIELCYLISNYIVNYNIIQIQYCMQIIIFRLTIKK